MAAVQLNSDSGRIAVLNDGTGAKIIASNQCGDFPFKLTKMIDPRVDIDSVADYDKNVVAYVGQGTGTSSGTIRTTQPLPSSSFLISRPLGLAT